MAEDMVAVQQPVLVRNNFPVNSRFPERGETMEELMKLDDEGWENFLDWAAQRDLDVSDLEEQRGGGSKKKAKQEETET